MNTLHLDLLAAIVDSYQSVQMAMCCKQMNDTQYVLPLPLSFQHRAGVRVWLKLPLRTVLNLPVR